MTPSGETDAMEAAIAGHLAGLGTSQQDFDERLRFLGVDPDYVKAAGQALREVRRPELARTTEGAYSGGFLDGFALALATVLAEGR